MMGDHDDYQFDIRGSDLEPGMMNFPIKWGAKEPQNPQNHRVDDDEEN